MKRLQAKRNLKRQCIFCNYSINKGDIYYKKRIVFKEDSEILTYEHLLCSKCKYKKDSHLQRFEKFKLKCPHKFIEEIWTYIPGECIKQPDHDKCLICGKWL